MPNFLSKALTMEHDITTTDLEENTEVYERTNVIKYERDKKNQIEKHYNDFKEMMRITTAAVLTERSVDSVLLQKVVFGLSFPRFFLASDECLLRCYSLWRNPDPKMLINVWDLPEHGAIKHCKGLTYCSITTCFYIHIPTKVEEYKLPNYNIFEENAHDETCPVMVLYYDKLFYKDERYQPSSCSCFPCFQPKTEDI